MSVTSIGVDDARIVGHLQSPFGSCCAEDPRTVSKKDETAIRPDVINTFGDIKRAFLWWVRAEGAPLPRRDGDASSDGIISRTAESDENWLDDIYGLS